VVGGKVSGKINATGKVVLESNAIFKGEMKAARLIIDDGAVFDGQCFMKNSGEEIKGKQASIPSELTPQKSSIK